MNRTALLAAAAVAASVWLWIPASGVTSHRVVVPKPWRAHLTPVAGAMGVRRRAAVSAVAAGFAVWALPSPWGAGAAVLTAAVSFIGLGRLEPATQRRARLALVLELPETLDLLASALEAGLPVRGAVAHVARMGPPAARPALRDVVARVGVGVGDADAWRCLASDPLWGQVALDLARSADSGTSAARVLRQHAEQARAQRKDQLLTRARAVGVRSTLPLMACFLPAFLLVGVVPVVAGVVTQFLQP